MLLSLKIYLRSWKFLWNEYIKQSKKFLNTTDKYYKGIKFAFKFSLVFCRLINNSNDLKQSLLQWGKLIFGAQFCFEIIIVPFLVNQNNIYYVLKKSISKGNNYHIIYKILR